MSDDDPRIRAAQRWLQTVVIDLGLCPFAAAPTAAGRVRFAVTGARDEASLLAALRAEIDRLLATPDIETSLLILDGGLADFLDFNDFLGAADALLEALHLDGVLQIASFHPDYRFAGTRADDPANHTNRSPAPMLHLLREESLTRVIDGGADTAGIPQRNIERMRALGSARLRQLLAACSTERD